MPTPAEQAASLQEQVVTDTINGVSSFGDGTHNVGMIDPNARLDVVDRLKRSEVMSKPARGMRF